MNKKRFNKDLLNEEIKKFKLMSEYAFYEERPEQPEDDELLLGVSEAEEEGGDEELEADAEDISSELGVGDEEAPADDMGDEEPMDEPGEEEMGEEPPIEEPMDEPMEEPAEDEVELDVTELVKGSEEAKASADAANANVERLMNMVSKLENQLGSMQQISSKIEDLESELEKRVPTEQEKLEMRSLDSAPYNMKLTDFWKDQEGMYDVMDGEGEEKEKTYVLTKDDVNSDYSEAQIKDSFDEDYFEDEI